jgi:hypothetical protein
MRDIGIFPTMNYCAGEGHKQFSSLKMAEGATETFALKFLIQFPIVQTGPGVHLASNPRVT